MIKKPTLWTGVSWLVVAVLVITAFVRGDVQLWLYIGVFAVWAIWATARFLVPYAQWRQRQYEGRRLQKQYEKSQAAALTVSKGLDPVGAVLLRHVNFRISAHLKSAYPEATWLWCEDAPEQIVAEGGTGRIEVFNVPDFNYAEVTFNQQGEINCTMLKVVPLALPSSDAPDDEPLTTHSSKQIPVDPQIWYEQQGRTVLENVISELNSRGHSSLAIKENGDITVSQAGGELKTAVLANVPAKTYWPRLQTVFQREGLAAEIGDDRVVLSW